MKGFPIDMVLERRAQRQQCLYADQLIYAINDMVCGVRGFPFDLALDLRQCSRQDSKTAVFARRRAEISYKQHGLL